jgi:hypothetical protein
MILGLCGDVISAARYQVSECGDKLHNNVTISGVTGRPAVDAGTYTARFCQGACIWQRFVRFLFTDMHATVTTERLRT